MLTVLVVLGAGAVTFLLGRWMGRTGGSWSDALSASLRCLSSLMRWVAESRVRSPRPRVSGAPLLLPPRRDDDEGIVVTAPSVEVSAASAADAPSILLGPPAPPPSVRFDPVAPRGTQTTDLEAHATEWKAAMRAVGEQLDLAGVGAIVFVHGTFAGSDPLSAYSLLERTLPSAIGPAIARTLRKKTRAYVERVFGDVGNFGTAYVRLFEEALRAPERRIACTEFIWSSENHHVGRLEGALGLIRVLATHAELSLPPKAGLARSTAALSRLVGATARERRILVVGHSHAGQLFALATQLLSRSIATAAITDVARARGVDVTALDADIATLTRSSWGDSGVKIDFVTFGAPNRYAWASVPNTRALHVVAVPKAGASGAFVGDLIQRLGVEGSDFPPLGGEDRRINTSLADALGHGGFAPARVAAAFRAGAGLPPRGDVAFVEYGDRGGLLAHGDYTRLDTMLFHARLVAERLYPRSASDASSAA